MGAGRKKKRFRRHASIVVRFDFTSRKEYRDEKKGEGVKLGGSLNSFRAHSRAAYPLIRIRDIPFQKRTSIHRPLPTPFSPSGPGSYRQAALIHATVSPFTHPSATPPSPGLSRARRRRNMKARILTFPLIFFSEPPRLSWYSMQPRKRGTSVTEGWGLVGGWRKASRWKKRERKRGTRCSPKVNGEEDFRILFS